MISPTRCKGALSRVALSLSPWLSAVMVRHEAVREPSNTGSCEASCLTAGCSRCGSDRGSSEASCTLRRGEGTWRPSCVRYGSNK